MKFILKNAINPCDIKLILVTHAHYDHVGNLAYLRKLTRARILVHEKDFDNLKFGLMKMPERGGNTWAGFVLRLGNIFKSSVNFDPVEADELIRSYHDLSGYGFNAHIIHTPGHSSGSVSLIFGDGQAFVGDTCFNIPLVRTLFPPFYDDKESILKSWITLNESRVNVFYPGHGKNFGINKLHKAIHRLEKKIKKH